MKKKQKNVSYHKILVGTYIKVLFIKKKKNNENTGQSRKFFIYGSSLQSPGR